MNFPDYIGSGQGVILSSWCGNAVDYTEAISEQKLQRVQFVLFLFLLFLARDALPFTVIIVYICIRATVRINKLKVCINIVIIINGSSCGKLIKPFFMKRSVAIPWFKHNSPPGLAPMLFSPF